MKLGYLRVSTKDQCEARQIDALRPICDALYVEKRSATARQRPVYDEVVARLKPGDSFVILDLDRAYRSALDALRELDRLHARGIYVQIASLNIDTASPFGKVVYTIVSGLAEFERALLSERTKQGLEAARKRGAQIGRPPKVSDAQVKAARRKFLRGVSVAKLAAELGVHSWTLRRRMHALGLKEAQNQDHANSSSFE